MLVYLVKVTFSNLYQCLFFLWTIVSELGEAELLVFWKEEKEIIDHVMDFWDGSSFLITNFQNLLGSSHSFIIPDKPYNYCVKF